MARLNRACSLESTIKGTISVGALSKGVDVEVLLLHKDGWGISQLWRYTKRLDSQEIDDVLYLKNRWPSPSEAQRHSKEVADYDRGPKKQIEIIA